MSRRIARSFTFLDVCGFTRYMTEHGDETAAGALGEIRAIIRRAAEHSGIRVGKWLGDGALLVAAERAPLNECLEDIWWWLPTSMGSAQTAGLVTIAQLLASAQVCPTATARCASLVRGAEMLAGGEKQVAARVLFVDQTSRVRRLLTECRFPRKRKACLARRGYPRPSPSRSR